MTQNPILLDIDREANKETLDEILRLKKKHNVLMLGHNYMEPLVFGLSESTEQGDSLALSMHAANTESKYILFNGVPFMAETAKILNPEKTVLVADKSAGCSLADNFDVNEIKELKRQHPGTPVMIYINSYANAKAESDIVCTSANAANIAKKLPGEKIIFIPDILFAKNLEHDLKGIKKVIYPGMNEKTKGSVCEVHERFTLQDMNAIRNSFELPKGHPKRMLYAHWECHPEVLRDADFYGSTSQIRKDISERVKKGNLEKAFIASECELTSNLQQEFPSVKFWTACSVRCSHMAKVKLEKILDVLKAIDEKDTKTLAKHEIILDKETIERARLPIQKMMDMSYR